MTKHRGGILSLFLILGVAACDGSPSGPSAQELTNAEIQDVAGKLRTESMVLLNIIPIGMRFNVLACNPEGAIYTEIRTAVSTQDPGTGDTRSTGTAKETHSDCRWSLTTPTPMTVNGSVHHEFDSTTRPAVGGGLAGTGTMTSNGTLTIEGASGKRRECAVELKYELTYHTGRGSVSGRFCGSAVAEEIDLREVG